MAMKLCEKCNGLAMIPCMVCRGTRQTRTCKACAGRGYHVCPRCDGRGLVDDELELGKAPRSPEEDDINKC